MTNLKFVKAHDPVKKLIDNKSTIKLMKGQKFHNCLKHNKVMHHFLRNEDDKSKIRISLVTT